LRTLTSNPKFSGGVDTAEMLEDVLDGIGFGGLWRSSSFHTINEHERQCTALTDRLIEVRTPAQFLAAFMLTSDIAYHCIT
jgi:neurofibromin 1